MMASPDEIIEGQVHVPADLLRDWTARVFTGCGMARAEAGIAADILVRTSLRGYDSHGVTRVPLYAGRMIDGEINPRAAHRGEMRDGTLFYHCDKGLGQVVAEAATRAAVAASETRPIVTCLMEGCGHLSALGVFTLLAAEAGKVAFLCQPTKPWMAMSGWTNRAIGNNPLSFAAPLDGRAPLVFDMAASVAARGAVMDARRDGTPILEGWAIGPDGAPTIDPEAAAAGSMLPIGDYKGIGLAMLVECLGASLIPRLGEAPGGRTRPGAFLIVANPALTSGLDFAGDMAAWLKRYQAASPRGDARYPGQRAAECEAFRTKTGIPLAPALCRELTNLGDRVGQPIHFPT